MLFSATYDNGVMKFAETVVPDPVVIRLRREEESLSNIKQYYVLCSNKEEKAESLSNIYGTITIGQAMIFCQVFSSYSSEIPLFWKFREIRKFQIERKNFRKNETVSLDKMGEKVWKKGKCIKNPLLI